MAEKTGESGQHGAIDEEPADEQECDRATHHGDLAKSADGCSEGGS